MKKTRIKLVPFSKIEKSLLKDPAVKRAYNDVEFEYKIISALIKARLKKGMTQKALADKIRISQSSLARLEAGRTNPRLSTLQKIVSEVGVRLVVK